MRIPGAERDRSPLMIESRRVLLDALEALACHSDAVILIGAQAVYLRAKAANVALAESTKDSDLALDPARLGGDPRVEKAMSDAGFARGNQPGSWVGANGVPVDLMVPEALAGRGRRSVEMPPHDSKAARRASGLEAVVVDNSRERITALDPADERVLVVKVAGPASLVIAKTFKIAERLETSANRVTDKDAHDLYRLLRATDTASLARDFVGLARASQTRDVTERAVGYLREYAAVGPEGEISLRAGRAEEGIGEPHIVAASTAFLAGELLTAWDEAFA